MSEIHAPSRRLDGGFGQRARRVIRATQRRLRSRLWFPHVPLFLLVGHLGLLQLRHAIGIAQVRGPDFLRLSTFTMSAVMDGAPSATTGVFLVVMAFGLLTRSRLAWVVALLGAVVSMTLILLVWAGGVSPHGALAGYNAVVLLALVAGGRAFNRSSLTSASLFAVASILLLIAYAVIGAYLLGAEFAPPISDLVAALYFAVETMSTVGYGDIVPKSPDARLFVISVMILGVAVFATSVSALLLPLINRRMQILLRDGEKKMPRSNHYVIASDSSLAKNTYKELIARDQQAVFILPSAPDPGIEHYDFVVGDPSDLDVLRRADAQTAKAVLALGRDDSENAFVVMAAKELAETPRTVAAVNDARNMERVKRVRPDVILAPQVLGGELLAMALSGEAVNSDELMQRLLHIAS